MIYSEFARVFDEYASNYDYDSWFCYIESLSRVASWQGRRVLEIGCGTGLILARFAQAGAAVWGVDVSPDMLAVARARFSGTGLKAVLVEADACGFESGEKFDFIYSAGDCLNYMDEESVGRLFSHVRSMLSEGAVFTFDVLNRDLMVNPAAGQLLRSVHGNLLLSRRVEADRMFTDIVIDGVIAETHMQHFHSLESLSRLALGAGLGVENVFEIMGTNPCGPWSEKMQFVTSAARS